MASTYVNNLRLEEIGSGEQSGSWGDTTNTNLEIIGQAVAWGTRAIANASTDNITIADGALDADRCLGLKLTGGGQACTVTLLPNTSSKTWFMYNATAAALTFTCGSGANVIIPAGQTKVIATDGLGSGGVVHDLLTAVNLAGATVVDDLTVSDDLTVTDDLTVGGIVSLADGTAGAPSLTNTGDVNAGLFFSAADTLAFSAGGTAQFTMADGVIAPVTDSDVDLGTSSLYFKNSYIDTVTTTGAITSGGNITRGGTVITDGSITDTGDFTIDVAGDIILDAAGDDILLKSAGTHEGNINLASSNLTFKSIVSDKDMIFQGNDGGSGITALTLDMSEAGAATFNSNVNAPNFNTTSDATLKTNVETLTGSLDAVKSLRGVSFDWIESGGSEVGVIAQEVEAVLPNVVSTNDEGIKSVKYGNMVALLIEAIKEQQAQIDELKDKLGE